MGAVASVGQIDTGSDISRGPGGALCIEWHRRWFRQEEHHRSQKSKWRRVQEAYLDTLQRYLDVKDEAKREAALAFA